MDTDIEHAIEFLQNGGVGILPTETLYGLVASAFDPDAVDRIYDLKQRHHNKPLIVLISDLAQLEQFGIVVSNQLEDKLRTYWPGPYSIILLTIDEQFEYIHRGTNSIGFRMPDESNLLDLITQTGPLVAPSANPEGLPPARTISEARAYFGHHVNVYEDGGTITASPSKLIDITGGTEKILR